MRKGKVDIQQAVSDLKYIIELSENIPEPGTDEELAWIRSVFRFFNREVKSHEVHDPFSTSRPWVVFEERIEVAVREIEPGRVAQLDLERHVFTMCLERAIGVLERYIERLESTDWTWTEGDFLGDVRDCEELFIDLPLRVDSSIGAYTDQDDATHFSDLPALYALGCHDPHWHEELGDRLIQYFHTINESSSLWSMSAEETSGHCWQPAWMELVKARYGVNDDKIATLIWNRITGD